MAAAAAVAGGEERNGGKRWALEVRRWGRGFAFVFGCKKFLEVLCLLFKSQKDGQLLRQDHPPRHSNFFPPSDFESMA